MTDAAHMPAVADVARTLLGEPQEATEAKLRFERYSLDLTNGSLYDFQQETRIDIVDLVARENLTDRDGALDWLAEHAPDALNGHARSRLPDELADERALIGLMMCRPALLRDADEEIGPSDFIHALHRRIFTVFLDAEINNYDPDVKTLVGALGGDNKEEVAPGYTLWKYIAHLAASAPATDDANAAALARTLARRIRQVAEIEDGDERALAEAEYVPELPKPWVSRFGAVPWEKLDEPGPEFSYVIDKWFSVGDKSIIGGPSKSGKSFLAIHAAMSIARSTPFFGAKVMAPGLVVYQAGEGARGVKKRLRAYRKHFGVPADERVPFVLLQSKVDLYRPEGDTRPLIEEIKHITSLYPGSPLRAVFIDTLATATGGADENSGKDMSTVMANIDRISAAFGCHVCLVHHLNAAGTKLRGHTSIFNNIDQAILVTRDEATKIRTAVLDKQKDDEDGVTLKFELKRVVLGHRPLDDEEISSCVCAGLSEREILQKSTAASGFALRPPEELIFRALMDAQRAKGRVPDRGQIADGIPPDVLVVDYRDWRDAYKQVGEPKADGSALDDETIRKRWRDKSPKLISMNIIGWQRPWIWWKGRHIRGFIETQPKPSEWGMAAPNDVGPEADFVRF